MQNDHHEDSEQNFQQLAQLTIDDFLNLIMKVFEVLINLNNYLDRNKTDGYMAQDDHFFHPIDKIFVYKQQQYGHIVNKVLQYIEYHLFGVLAMNTILMYLN